MLRELLEHIRMVGFKMSEFEKTTVKDAIPKLMRSVCAAVWACVFVRVRMMLVCIVCIYVSLCVYVCGCVCVCLVCMCVR